MKLRVFLALSLALVWAAVASAQQMQPVVLVDDWYVKPGKEQEFIKLVKEVQEPIFAKLMAEGAVLAWGVDVPILHREGGRNISIWLMSPDTGTLDKYFAAFEQMVKKMGEEHTRAAEEARRRRELAPRTLWDRFLETVDDPSKHKDWLFRILVFGYGSAQPPADLKPYSWITLTRVLPGKSSDYRQTWEKYNKPVLDKLVKEGAILGYEFGVEEARSTDAFSHFTVVALPNLAAREKVRAAFDADRQARSPEERNQITQSFLSVIDPSASRTLVLRAVIFHVAPPKM